MCEHIYPVFYNFLSNVASVRTLCHERRVLKATTHLYIFLFLNEVAVLWILEREVRL